MRKRVIGAAKSAAGLAAGFGAVILVTAVLVGVVLTCDDMDGDIDRC